MGHLNREPISPSQPAHDSAPPEILSTLGAGGMEEVYKPATPGWIASSP
jgi:hypothetical protein